MKKSKLYYIVKNTEGLEIAVSKYDMFEEVPPNPEDIILTPSNLKNEKCPWLYWKQLKRLSDQKSFYFSSKALKTNFFTTKCLKTAKILYEKR
jgi:hypothetical protein